jgi:hypothetical protein
MSIEKGTSHGARDATIVPTVDIPEDIVICDECKTTIGGIWDDTEPVTVPTVQGMNVTYRCVNCQMEVIIQ